MNTGLQDRHMQIRNSNDKSFDLFHALTSETDTPVNTNYLWYKNEFYSPFPHTQTANPQLHLTASYFSGSTSSPSHTASGRCPIHWASAGKQFDRTAYVFDCASCARWKCILHKYDTKVMGYLPWTANVVAWWCIQHDQLPTVNW